MTTSLIETSSAPEPVAESGSGHAGRSRIVERGALAVLLIATAVMYLWNITANGMGNQFYAGATWAGSKNWEALLFGSLDPHNFITVDKPPVSQWVMGLSGQLFGFSSASMLVPQALMAVVSVALLYAAVKRVTRNPWFGLLAGVALAVIPVCALMFRFNNPDAVMVLLMMAGAYATVRAIEKASTTWILLAGAALGFAFLAKMLEGLMVMPALALAYLIAAPNPIRTRLLQLVGALVALLVSSGWYVLLTLLWPASSRPYLAGSTDNNFMNLVLGYNGFARVLGKNHGGGGRGAPAGNAAQTAATAHPGMAGGRPGGFGGQTHGLQRLFTGEFGFEISWLLPTALVAFVLVLIARRTAARTDMIRAGAIVFGGWIIVDGGVLSYMSGMVHPYYCMSIAPAVAGMFAIGFAEMWNQRDTALGRFGGAALLAITGVWSFVLLHRNSGWQPELRWAIIAVTLVAAVLIALPWTYQAHRKLAAAVLTVGLIAGLGGATAYSLTTIAAAHSGGNPTVGPAQAGGQHGGFGGQTQNNPQLTALLQATNSQWAAATNGSSAAAALELQSDKAVMAIGGFGGSDPAPTLAQFQADVRDGKLTYYVVTSNSRGGGGTGGANAGHTPATGPQGGRQSGAQQGGNAGGPGGSGGGFGGRNTHADITNWVTKNFTAQKVGSATVYNLSGYHG